MWIDGRHYTMYEATQKQRAIERAMRAQKKKILVSEATGDPNLPQLQSRMQVLSQEYSRFSKAAGLRTQVERTQVAGVPGRRIQSSNSSMDYMGRPQNFIYKGPKNKEIITKAYAVDGHKGFFTQTNSKDAKNTIALIERERQVIPQLQTVDEIIIKKDLPGVASYERTTHRLYVHEKISNPEFIESDVANGYFVAENAEEALKHEIHHKEHHDLIDRKMLTSNKDRVTVKQEIEADLRAYVMRQKSSQPNYVFEVVSPNAAYKLIKDSSLNELIAEVLLQKDKGMVKDPFLLKKIEEMFNDAAND